MNDDISSQENLTLGHKHPANISSFTFNGILFIFFILKYSPNLVDDTFSKLLFFSNFHFSWYFISSQENECQDVVSSMIQNILIVLFFFNEIALGPHHSPLMGFKVLALIFMKKFCDIFFLF